MQAAVLSVWAGDEAVEGHGEVEEHAAHRRVPVGCGHMGPPGWMMGWDWNVFDMFSLKQNSTELQLPAQSSGLN
ncbi:hypothetical protein GCM10017781_24320 [Deinococcus metalli]|uniref:Uncharacterized protein n=1 Tax=Deinococcus metalli TaxID=1141878 RepID=A0ABQ3JRA6_9DEIO|nr:hypothetical protein GCM10017781_24320 [Deinococcus metalli]